MLSRRTQSISMIVCLVTGCLLAAGCYAPLRSPGVLANTLPEEFRIPLKATSIELNYATLTQRVPESYILGPEDLIRVDVSDVTPFEGIDRLDGIPRNDAARTPSTSRETLISPGGTVLLPLVGNVKIAGLNIEDARKKIVDTYLNRFLDDPKVQITLVEKRTVGVMVVGGVTNPGLYRLPKYENDIAHAIAAAGGLIEDQDEIQVHRRHFINSMPQNANPAVSRQASYSSTNQVGGRPSTGKTVFRGQSPDPQSIYAYPLNANPTESSQYSTQQYSTQQYSTQQYSSPRVSTLQDSNSQNPWPQHPHSGQVSNGVSSQQNPAQYPSIQQGVGQQGERQFGATQPMANMPLDLPSLSGEVVEDGGFSRSTSTLQSTELPSLPQRSPKSILAQHSNSGPASGQNGNASHPFDLNVLRIPLRSCNAPVIKPEQTVLNEGDVVVVKQWPDEVFFVVGQLNPNNQFRLNAGNSRDLGNGFVLPRDRDVDVITAVAMAGYIDPIDSPTTVTVHRQLPNANPLLIKIDLIAARYDRLENVMVRPGDIIYLNPDPSWWMRRTFDRIVPELILSPYDAWMRSLLDPGRFN